MKSEMRIGIFSPYLDTLGGGERYILTLAQLLSKDNNVEIFWNDDSIRSKVKDFFAIDLKNITFSPNFFLNRVSFLKRILKTKEYDLLVILSDGSIPTSLAKRTILHFQEPFNFKTGKNFLNRLKFKRISKVVVNSFFTERFIDQTFGVKSMVIYPPCDVEEFKNSERKENIIVSVGRFDDYPSSKNQPVLIETFKRLKGRISSSWKLVLVGGLKEDDKRLLNGLKSQAKGYPIEILVNLSFPKLVEVFSNAKIYWHAKGFGENEEENPQNCEHFGISTVEAMASGCVPIVIGKGGLKEIVSDGKDGFLWNDLKDLEEKTLKVEKNEDLRVELSKKAILKSQQFSQSVFEKKFKKLISEI